MTDKKKAATVDGNDQNRHINITPDIDGKQEAKKPPVNTLHANRWDEFPDTVKPGTYRVIDADRTFTVRKKTRQTLEGLLNQPVACASKCRISDRVLILRRDCGLNIEMEMFQGDGTSQGENYGVYFFKSEIERVGVRDAS